MRLAAALAASGGARRAGGWGAAGAGAPPAGRLGWVPEAAADRMRQDLSAARAEAVALRHEVAGLLSARRRRRRGGGASEVQMGS
jgi:hypothetical protein